MIKPNTDLTYPPGAMNAAYDHGFRDGFRNGRNSTHFVEWLGVFQNEDEKSAELGFCTSCQKEIHDGQDGHRRRP